MKTFPVSLASALAVHVGLAGVVLGNGNSTTTSAVVASRPIDIEMASPDPNVEQTVTNLRAPARDPRPIAVSRKPNKTSSEPTVTVTATVSATAVDTTQPPPPRVEPMRFALSAAAHEEVRATSVDASGVLAQADIVADSGVTVRARKLSGAPPEYPKPALAEGVELDGPIPFEIVVGTNGRVEELKPLSHAGYGFDEAAAAALRTFTFSPALRGGVPVRVRMRWTVDFRLN